MSNLYYNYRGDPPPSRPLTNTAPSLPLPPKDSSTSLSSLPPPLLQPRPSTTAAAHQAWADTSLGQPQQQSFRQNMSVNPSRQVPPPQHRRYDDSLYAVINKQTRPQQNHQPVIDSFHALRSATAAGQSGVFDPSEFPSLGGAAVPMQPTVLGSSPSVDPGVMAMQSGNFPNGMSTYQDLYGVTTYADGRGKAVEAVTGANPPVEFSMTNEDFPALGGGAAALRGAPSLISAPNGNPVGQSVRLTGDGYETAQLKNVQSQLHAVLGRGNLRVDQTNGGLIASGRPPTDYPVGETLLGGPGAANFLRVSSQKHVIPESSRRSPTRGYRSSSPPPVAGRAGVAQDVPRVSADEIVSPAKKNMADVEQRIPNGNSEIPSMKASLNANGTTLKHASTGSSDGNSRSSSHDADNTNTTKKSGPERRPFDMLGLLKYVKPEAEGTIPHTLSIGYDLTLMGLDLNSMEPLHRTFGTPWDSALSTPLLSNGGGLLLKNEEPEFKLPTCYYMQPPQLKNSHFAKFTAETLFYVFYNMPKDVLQLLSAIELYHRKWMYHKDLKLWFHQVETADKFDHVQYAYFDIKSWEKRPFADATKQFIQGLMTEEELKKFPMPGGTRNVT